MTTLADIQRRVGVTPDGVWGPRTAAAIWAALPDVTGQGTPDMLNVRILAETVEHEAIVQESYKDSVGVWTWAIGLTAAAGVDVTRYKDKPASIEECLRAFVARVRAQYLPDVLAAFGDRALTEAQLAAALSFHYNTGAIKRADWVKLWLAGRVTEARTAFMNWRSPASIILRREKERDLFFDGKWTQTGFATVYPVSKPSYQPAFGKGKRIDIRSDLERALA